MTQEEKSDKQKILDSLNSPLYQALESEGITPSYLAKLLKKELHAKEKKVFAFQGHIGDEIELEALDIQQKARQDAHKLLDHYPAERHRFEGEIIEKRSSEELAALRDIAQGVAEALRHNVKPSDDKG